jgi:hypothetical protein
MTAQPQYQLEMHWILDGGCLRLVWTASQPQPSDIDLPIPAIPQLEKQAA